MKTQSIFRTFAAILPAFMISSLVAEVPSLINYQGRLTDAQGNPVSGNRTMVVRIYDSPTGGNMTYEENIGTVSVQDGKYSFRFGASGALTVGANETIATTNGSNQVYNGTLIGNPNSETLSISDGTYSWTSSGGSSNASAFSVTYNGTAKTFQIIYLNQVPVAGRAIVASYQTTEVETINASLEGGEAHLALIVNGTEEATRSRLLAVPYALKAKVSETSVDAQMLATQVSGLSGNLTTVQSQTSTLSSNVANISSNLTTIQNQSTTMNATIGALGSNITSLQNQNTALSSNLTTVQGQTATLSTNVGTLQTQSSVVDQELIPIITRLNPVTVSTLTGTANAGFADGNLTTARFAYPTAIAADSSGNLFVADHYNHRIRKITPQGVVSTLAGSGNAGFADGTETSASFNYPSGVAVDNSGNVYVGDLLNNRVRKITSGGVVTTLAGNGTAGFSDGNGTSAMFNYPSGLAVDGNGNVYVADRRNGIIRKITSNGTVSTFANLASAGFGGVDSVAIDSSGNIYTASNGKIIKITSQGIISPLAGSGTSGFADGNGQNAMLTPSGVAVDSKGVVYVGDYDNNRVRRVSPAGFVTTLAGNGTAGSADGDGQSARFNRVYGLAVDPTSGNLYVVDQNNSRIRKITFQ